MKHTQKLIQSILFVEGNKNTQKELSSFLKDLCVNLYITNNAEEALEIFKEESIDLIISDVKMPKIDGITMYQEIQKVNHEQAILFLINLNNVEYLKNVLELQATGYIPQPIDLDILYKKILDIGLKINLKEKENTKHQEMQTIFNTTLDGIAIIDLDTNFLSINKAYEQMTGYSKAELYTTSSANITARNDYARNLEAIQTVIKGGCVKNFEKAYLHKNGTKIFVNMSFSLMPDKQRILIAAKDVTQLKKKEQLLKDYISIVDKNVLTSTTNLKGIITYTSDAFCKLSGYTKDELIGSNHNIIRHQDMPKELFKNLWKTIKSGEIWRGEIKNRKKDGSFYWVSTTITPIYDENKKPIGFTAVRHDITDKKIVEKLSNTDALTELYNRRYFDLKFTPIADKAKKDGKIFSFLIMDIDYFKQYNDTYGHQKGDDVLKSIAKVLQKATKNSDDYAFRLGGEEFGIISISENIEESHQFAHNVRKEIQALAIPHRNNKASNVITVSLGLIALHVDNTFTQDNIYKSADTLLYKAKENGRNQVVIN